MDQATDESLLSAKHLIAARVPAYLYFAVQQRADEELISIASFVRRCLLQTVQRADR